MSYIQKILDKANNDATRICIGCYQQFGEIEEIYDICTAEHNNITSLSIIDFTFDSKGSSMLAHILMHEHNKVTYMSLSGVVDSNNEYVIKISNALTTVHNKLTYLNLWNNIIGSEGATAIANALTSEHNKLRYLTIRVNTIDDKGVKAIANALTSEHNKLVDLFISCNYIGSEGSTAIANALTHEHNKIKSMYIGWNIYSSTDANVISNVATYKHNKLLVFLMGTSGKGKRSLNYKISSQDALYKVDIFKVDVFHESPIITLKTIHATPRLYRFHKCYTLFDNLPQNVINNAFNCYL